MDQVFKSGQMVLNTRESGDLTKPMVKESSGMPMEMYTRVIGKKTRQTALVLTSMLMEQNTRDTGRMISKTDMELNPGQMAASMKVTTKRE